MSEVNYSNREINAMFHGVHERLSAQDTTLTKILTQTTKTNGKIRKITFVLAIVATVVLTLLIVNGSPFAHLLLSLIK